MLWWSDKGTSFVPLHSTKPTYRLNTVTYGQLEYKVSSSNLVLSERLFLSLLVWTSCLVLPAAVPLSVWAGPRAVCGRARQAAPGHSGWGAGQGGGQGAAGEAADGVTSLRQPWRSGISNSGRLVDRLHLNSPLIAGGCVCGAGTLTSKEMQHLNSEGSVALTFFSFCSLPFGIHQHSAVEC